MISRFTLHIIFRRNDNVPEFSGKIPEMLPQTQLYPQPALDGCGVVILEELGFECITRLHSSGQATEESRSF